MWNKYFKKYQFYLLMVQKIFFSHTIMDRLIHPLGASTPLWRPLLCGVLFEALVTKIL